MVTEGSGQRRTGVCN